MFSSSLEFPINPRFFKEDIVNEILEIPCQKPDMESILNTTVWPQIESYKLIETEKGVSNEGQTISGLKLLVKLKLNQKVMYVANLCDQPVHSAHYENVKTMFVVLPEEIDGEKTCVLLKKGKLSITPFVECVETRMLDERLFQKCVMLFLNVDKN